MGIGAGLYVYDIVVKSSRSLSHLLMSSCQDIRTASYCETVIFHTSSIQNAPDNVDCAKISLPVRES